MKDLAATLAMLKGYEGNVPHMYLDTRGYVTVGVGFLLDCPERAAGYRFYRIDPEPDLVPSHLQPATPEQITTEWLTIKRQIAGRPAYYYMPFTTLEMRQDDIDAALAQKIQQFEAIALQAMPDWHSFPAPAQLALLDMIYNLGSLRHFPKLVTAAQHRDWSTCAQECRRRGPGELRNRQTKARFLEAAEEQPLGSPEVLAPHFMRRHPLTRRHRHPRKHGIKLE